MSIIERRVRIQPIKSIPPFTAEKKVAEMMLDGIKPWMIVGLARTNYPALGVNPIRDLRINFESVAPYIRYLVPSSISLNEAQQRNVSRLIVNHKKPLPENRKLQVVNRTDSRSKSIASLFYSMAEIASRDADLLVSSNLSTLPNWKRMLDASSEEIDILGQNAGFAQMNLRKRNEPNLYRYFMNGPSDPEWIKYVGYILGFRERINYLYESAIRGNKRRNVFSFAQATTTRTKRLVTA